MAVNDVQISCLQVADIQLPPEVEGLYDLAYNLWWSWTPEARRLFASIDREAWARYRNPVDLLLNFERTRWEGLLDDDAFTSSYSAVMQSFRAYMSGEGETWFSSRRPGYQGGPVAYFSMEYGLHQCLPLYSGGLGVLSGDHCKSASDLGIPFVGLGLMYRSGYFRQAIDADGIQQHIYPEYDFTRLPVRPALDSRGRTVVVMVPMDDREVAAKVWVAQVGRVPLLLLDTDIRENDPADRRIAAVLYVRGREMRLAQEMVLGVGGVQALEALGIEPAVWHINEGHSAMLQLARLRRLVRKDKLPFQQALERCRSDVVFTTHTPVQAGNEQFEAALARRYLRRWAEELETDTETLLRLGWADHGNPEQPLNLTAFALRSCRFANAVSRINAEVSDRMWRHLFPDLPPEQPAVEPITNGVHLPTWIGLELRALLMRRLNGDWLVNRHDPESWKAIAEIPDGELWEAHQGQKQRLFRFTRSRLREQYARHGRSPGVLRGLERLFDPEVLTIGFARRFATYKRADLVFSDLHRLRHLLCHPERPVQIFLAGKAHPADRPGQGLIQHIFQLSQEADLHGRVVFLEDYDMRVARMLVQGVDVWLNTPRPPLEASGTSGQKASANGVLNFSVLDGWWPEGYDGENGWAIGREGISEDEWRRDQEDALSLYQTLEDEIIPAYYERDANGLSARWLAMMKRAISSIAPRFSSARMVRDYAELAYLPLIGKESG